MKKAMIVSFVTSLLALGGCANSGAVKIGPDTYQVSTRVALGGIASAKGDALKEANAFCDSKGREILVTNTRANECALRGGCGEAEIIFLCLAAGDPQLQRPKFKTESGQKVGIEIQQK